jgi:hypothetical protein
MNMYRNSLKLRFLFTLLAISITTINAQTFNWVKSMGGPSLDTGLGTDVDSSGNVFVTGGFNGVADFNAGGSGGTLTSAGGTDVFLAKFDAGGNFLWAKSMGGNVDDGGNGVAVDGSGNVYVIGQFTSATADFNPGGSGGTLTNAGDYDVFLAKYDAGGNFLWVKSMGSNGVDQGEEVAVDASGNVYVTGHFTSAIVDFNPGGSGGTLTNTSANSDIFLAKYDGVGNFLWAKSMGEVIATPV